LQQRVLAEQGIVFRPRQPRPARPAIEPLVPEFAGAPIELPEALGVRRSPVVLVVAPELGIEGLRLLVHRHMSVLLAPSADRSQAPAEPLAHRPYMDGELPSSAASADVRKTEKVEAAGFLPLPLRAFPPVPGEWQHSLPACLLDCDRAGLTPAGFHQEVSPSHSRILLFQAFPSAMTMSAVSSTFRAHYCMHSEKSAISLSLKNCHANPGSLVIGFRSGNSVRPMHLFGPQLRS
jgi:hypothetical protein